MAEENTQRKALRKQIEEEYVCDLNRDSIITMLRRINHGKQYVIFRQSDTVENTIVSTVKTRDNKILHVRYLREPNGKYATDDEDMATYEYLNPQDLILQFKNTETIVLNKYQVLELMRNEDAEIVSGPDESNDEQKIHPKKCTMM